MGATASSVSNPAFQRNHQQKLIEYADRPWQQKKKEVSQEKATEDVIDESDSPEMSLLKDWIHDNEKQLNEAIQNSGADDLNIKVQDFLSLLQASTGERNKPPLNYFISHATFEGHAASESSQFRCRFEITLLKGKWTSVPLFADSVAMISSSISYKSEYTLPDLNNKDPFAVIRLEPHRDLLLLEPNETNKTEKKIITPQTNQSNYGNTYTSAYTIGVYKNSYSLIASQPGTYTVDMTILVPYATSRKTGFTLGVPRAVQNQIIFKVSDRDILIKVDPCLFGTQAQIEEDEEQVFVSTKDNKKEMKKITKSIVTARFPPTDYLSVQWTENMGTNVTVEETVELSANVEQKCLVSVGEGILIVYNLVSYKIVSGQMSLFEVEIDKRLKVISVEGSKKIPVKKWVVEDKKKSKSKGKEEVNENESGKKSRSKPLLKVWLEYGIEKDYEFTIISEMELEHTSCQVQIPTFNSLVMKEVTRDKGYVAVEARTNVEIAELSSSALDTVDVSEIPDSLFDMAEFPLLFGYKYLVPEYKLEIDVKKHADVGVLIAVVDSALYTAICSEEGSVMHKLILRVKNTQKQYARLSIPKEVEIWSTLVDGAAVKPAMDDKGMIMIPLEKASKNAKDSTTNCTIELIYMRRGESFGQTGNVLLDFPSCDVPITRLFISVYLPEGFKYKQFQGMKEVKYWNGTPPSSSVAPPPPSGARNRVQRQHSGIFMEMDMNLDVKKEKAKPMMKKNAVSSSAWGGGHKGVLPVKVEIPATGQEFKFQQLLVTDRDFHLSVEYSKKKKSGGRKINGCCG